MNEQSIQEEVKGDDINTHTDREIEQGDREEPKSRSPLSVLFFGFLGAALVAVLIFYAVVFVQVKKLSDHPIIIKSARLFQISAVKAGEETLLYADYRDDVASLKRLSANPSLALGGATDQEISDMVVGNFLSTVKIHQLAKQYGVTVTPSEIEGKKQDLLAQYGAEEVKKGILESYGWDIETFVQKIIEPGIWSTKVREYYEKNTLLKDAVSTRQEANVSHILFQVTDKNDAKQKRAKRQAAEAALKRLKKGEDFAAVALEVSEDVNSKTAGGNLGWVPKGTTVEAFDSAAFSLEPKKLSDIIETSYGYHILKVDERRTVADFGSFMQVEAKKVTPQFFVPLHNPLETTSTQGAPEIIPTE